MRFKATPDGRIWTQTTSAYDFWERYLAVFDEVAVVARVEPVPDVEPGYRRADGPGVSFVRVPHYIGLAQFTGAFVKIYRLLQANNGANTAKIYRIPSVIAELSTSFGGINSFPYGTEVVGDPFDVFAPGAIKHPLRPFLRFYFKRHTAKFCRGAKTVAYVNQSVLSKRYPPNDRAFVTAYSSVDLPEEAFLRHRPPYKAQKRIIILFIGSLAQNYKGADVLIEAVHHCRKAGYDFALRIVGDGQFRRELENQSKKLGENDRVSFVGQLPAGKAIRMVIDRCDLLVLPARTEGLPRVIIEAMARSKPCISTTVGGIPELLPPEDLVPPNDPAALTKKIIEVISDPDRMNQMGARNYRKARAYRKEILDQRRQQFYSHLRTKTEQWIEDSGRK
jgi:glycosyltransferase involved in cell wall biosynthesis